MNLHPTVKSRVLEIAELLEKGSNTKELLKELSLKWECSKRTIYRLINFAKDLLDGKLFNREEALNIIRMEAIAHDFENNLLTTLELEAKLCKLAGQEDLNPRERIQAILGVLRIRGQHSKLLEKQKAADNKDKPKVFEIKYTSEEERKLLERI